MECHSFLPHLKQHEKYCSEMSFSQRAFEGLVKQEKEKKERIWDRMKAVVKDVSTVLVQTDIYIFNYLLYKRERENEELRSSHLEVHLLLNTI